MAKITLINFESVTLEPYGVITPQVSLSVTKKVSEEYEISADTDKGLFILILSRAELADLISQIDVKKL